MALSVIDPIDPAVQRTKLILFQPFALGSGHAWDFAPFKIVIGIVVGVMTLSATCCTCCLAAFPYVGAVILLPLTAFFAVVSALLHRTVRPRVADLHATETAIRRCGVGNGLTRRFHAQSVTGKRRQAIAR